MKTTRISKSFYGMFAASNSCFPTTAKSSQKLKWVTEKDLYKADITGVDRIVTPVYIDTDMYKKTYMMDCVTGSLYKLNDGNCLSSERLKMLSFIKSDELKKTLVKVKSQDAE